MSEYISKSFLSLFAVFFNEISKNLLSLNSLLEEIFMNLPLSILPNNLKSLKTSDKVDFTSFILISISFVKFSS